MLEYIGIDWLWIDHVDRMLFFITRPEGFTLSNTLLCLSTLPHNDQACRLLTNPERGSATM